MATLAGQSRRRAAAKVRIGAVAEDGRSNWQHLVGGGQCGPRQHQNSRVARHAKRRGEMQSAVQAEPAPRKAKCRRCVAVHTPAAAVNDLRRWCHIKLVVTSSLPRHPSWRASPRSPRRRGARRGPQPDRARPAVSSRPAQFPALGRSWWRRPAAAAAGRPRVARVRRGDALLVRERRRARRGPSRRQARPSRVMSVDAARRHLGAIAGVIQVCTLMWLRTTMATSTATARARARRWRRSGSRRHRPLLPGRRTRSCRRRSRASATRRRTRASSRSSRRWHRTWRSA